MIKMIADGLKDFFGRMFESEQAAEYRFLSQAQTHAQLEALQRQWERNRGRSGW